MAAVAATIQSPAAAVVAAVVAWKVVDKMKAFVSLPERK
jgi:hypothetical protein